MTRINTNVSSLVAQNRLNRTNMDLQTSLTRLSTGLRINTGKDDPAGLIASEALRSDITSLNKAISNTRRAVQIIATADSALGQVSTLLNNIRGLIVEAANRGALSDDEIAANQLQIDSSLEAINRISQTTTFQGRKLLDGSLDFVSNISTVAAVTDSKINSANLGSTGSLSVDVAIEQAATQAELTATFDRDAASATLNLGVRDNILTNVAVSSNTITADVTIEFVRDTNVAVDEVVAAFDANTNTITVSGNGSTATSITRADVAAAINTLTDFSASSSATDGVDFSSGGTLPADATITGAVIDITADTEGSAFNGVEIVLQAGAALGATYSASSRQITVTYVAGTSDADDIAGAIDGLADFTATASSGGAKVSNAGDIAANANTGFSGGEALLDNLVFELTGSTGAQSFNFGAGTTVQQIVGAINLLTDSTGVEAEYADGTLTLNDSQYGAKSLVAVSVIGEGDDGEFQTNLSGIRDQGTDIVARINGTEANGSGNTLSINSTSLSMSLTVDPESTTTNFSFNITGGGALFQLGGEVVSNQQARLGIGSVSTSTLGGVNGRLYELGSGQEKALDSDINGAGKVIDEVIDKVTGLRGRLGAFQATTLESNLVSLTDTVANLTEAESSIRDADFAQESARLTRAQILIQSGTSVLAIANQNPQNVLSLLR